MNIKLTSTILISSILSAFTAVAQDSTERGGATAEHRGPPAFVQELREGIQSVRQTLQESRGEVLGTLEGASLEERREAMTAWREANADQIALLREMTSEMREIARDFRDSRAARPERPERPEVAQERQDLRANTESIREARQSLGQTMRQSSLSPEERQAEIEAFRSQQQELIEERKEIRRAMRERRAGAGEAGERRLAD